MKASVKMTYVTTVSAKCIWIMKASVKMASVTTRSHCIPESLSVLAATPFLPEVKAHEQERVDDDLHEEEAAHQQQPRQASTALHTLPHQGQQWQAEGQAHHEVQQQTHKHQAEITASFARPAGELGLASLPYSLVVLVLLLAPSRSVLRADLAFVCSVEDKVTTTLAV